MEDLFNGAMFVDYPDIVSIAELQQMLRIGRNTAYSILNDGTIKAHRIGNRYIIPKLSVIEYVNSIFQ
ncbi:MAG: helix-turn-helix domain-containing protein [Clostridia bacterium]|nr:helix-turn-helix domain-containing protein [Clostridia bacterium]